MGSSNDYVDSVEYLLYHWLNIGNGNQHNCDRNVKRDDLYAYDGGVLESR